MWQVLCGDGCVCAEPEPEPEPEYWDWVMSPANEQVRFQHGCRAMIVFLLSRGVGYAVLSEQVIHFIWRLELQLMTHGCVVF
jgi:hypothetical protein